MGRSSRPRPTSGDIVTFSTSIWEERTQFLLYANEPAILMTMTPTKYDNGYTTIMLLTPRGLGGQFVHTTDMQTHPSTECV